MTLKRRGFLQMCGRAVAAPLMPSVSMGAATKVAYPASALHATIYHAQSRVNFSAFALAQKLGLSLGQAELLMVDMSARGILGSIQGTTKAGQWALSKVWNRPFVDAAAARRIARGEKPHQTSSSRTPASDPQPTQQWSEPDMRPILTHLYDMCRARGMTLHPRCAV